MESLVIALNKHVPEIRIDEEERESIMRILAKNKDMRRGGGVV